MTTQSKGSDFGDGWGVREQAMASLPPGLFLASCDPRTFSKGGSRYTASWPEPSADLGQRTECRSLLFGGRPCVM